MEQDPYVANKTVTWNKFLSLAINLAQPPKPSVTSLEHPLTDYPVLKEEILLYRKLSHRGLRPPSFKELSIPFLQKLQAVLKPRLSNLYDPFTGKPTQKAT